MDFLNPKKQKRDKIQLIVGYVLLVIIVGLTTLVLVFAAEGYGFGKDGQIIQNGFVFVSSNPNPAQVYLNGQLYKSTTNTRLQLPAGQYTLKISRNGYRPWQRSLDVEGGATEHFDYPFLFPNNLITTTMVSFASKPSVVTDSPDRRWIIASDPANINSFTMYDVSNPKQPVKSTLTLPADILSSQTGSWRLAQWSTDNQHVLLEHISTVGDEYVMLDIKTPANSLNLTKKLNLKSTSQISLFNEKYDQYFLYDTKALTLDTVTLSDLQPTHLLDDVLAYKANGSSVILYATTKDASAGHVNFDIWQGSTNYVVQQESAGKNYLVNITQYQGSWYAVFGNGSSGKIYIYQDPVAQLQNKNLPLVPAYILKISNPDFLQFSANAQFIAAEGGNDFAVYDIFNQKGYVYRVDLPLSAGETAQWMDGDRLMLISGGKLVVFDYDNANLQTLQPAADGYIPLFDPAYKWSYTLAPSGQKQTPYGLTSTSMLIPADQ